MKNEFKVIADLIEKDNKVLDVGCGGGQLIEEIAKSVGIAGKAIGIDPSSSQISSAKDLCSDLENTLFICCLANNIDLKQIKLNIN